MSPKSNLAQDFKEEFNKLRDGLESNFEFERKASAKRVISLMRSGENVGSLFSSMLRCVKTSDLELKRIVYNYIVTYSVQEKEQTIMVINTFLQDMEDKNPFVRALSIRTMSRIQNETVAESMLVALKKCLCDKDPFVRKTAVLAVAKLYQIIPEQVENAGFFNLLSNLLIDDNPLVIANTTATILEINMNRVEQLNLFNDGNVRNVLNALSSCNVWCQTMLLDALSVYKPDNENLGKEIINRLLPFLKSSNASVIVSTFKCIYFFMNYDTRDPKEILNLIVPPFISLLNSAETEIQYVVLRTLSLLSQKYPKILCKEIRVFFCKYNDPSYVKLEKLDIIYETSNQRNVSIILDELTEYCNEIDVKFVRKTIKVIGQIALKIPESSNRCVDILASLIEGKAEYAIEESIVVLTNLLRKYPGKFESVISKLCSNIIQIKESNARSSLIWILGEYCEKIESVDVILDQFLDSFQDEPQNVQLQIISSVVKIYLMNPEQTKDQIQYILNEATKESVLPDIRDRAMFYWRLLSIDQKITKKVLNVSKTDIENSHSQFTDEVLNELLFNIGNVSCVLHEIQSIFLQRKIDDSYFEKNNLTWRPLPIRNSSTLVQINGYWDSNNYHLQVINIFNKPLSNFALAVKPNSAGFTIISALEFPSILNPNEQFDIKVPYQFIKTNEISSSAVSMDFALRVSEGIVYFVDFIDFHQITSKIKMNRKEFLEKWKEFKNKHIFSISNVNIANDLVLRKHKLNIIAKREGEICLAFAFRDRIYLADIESKDNIKFTIKGDPIMFKFIEESARYAFCIE